MVYIVFSFYSTVLDRVNREGMPKLREGGDFSEIADLDSICQQNGAEEIARKREPFCLGRPYDDAKTVFKMGEVIILNKSFGYHPDRNVTVFVPKGSAVPGIVDEFEKYFLKKPSTRDVQQPLLDSSTRFIQSFS